MENQLKSLQHQQQMYEALMRQPQNAAVLGQADYLNGLFRKKAFSWTATMTDLETVLPEGVQVLSLDPAVTKSGRVEIHLRVSGAQDRAIALVQNLEKSRHFAETRISAQTQAQAAGQNNEAGPVSASSLVNFDILADYRPLSAEEAAAAKKVAAKKVATKKVAAKKVAANETTKKATTKGAKKRVTQ
jgi:type IV pilus assembly protein PilN